MAGGCVARSRWELAGAHTAATGHEFKRLEIGYLIAEFCDRDAQNVMDSIGHPIEAWNAADPQRKEAGSEIRFYTEKFMARV